VSDRGPRLELNWIGKDDRRAPIEPRILREDAAVSYQSSMPGIVDNRLIFGDNLLALKALEAEFGGEVKCIYIDPPFNTGSAFEHYDDGVEHSLWLTLMRERFEILHRLLRFDGVLVVHLDDSEAAYAKVLLDEVFGRANYLNTVTLTTNAPSGFKATSATLFSTANHLLFYARDKRTNPLRRVFVPKPYDTAYSKYLLDREAPIAEWRWVGLADKCAEVNGFDSARKARKELGETFDSLLADFAINGEQIVFYEDRLVEIDGARVPGEIVTDVWTDIGWTGIAREGGVEFKNGKKPEALIRRVLQLCTDPGDLVLDSFAGSGTTGAVAHKMGRRWIMVELGEHCHTHILPRLRRVIDGEDKTGVTEAAGWTGGGGLRYFRIAPSLIQIDSWGRQVISKEFDAAMLAEALCKLEGFTYAPSDSVYWQHGRSSERDYIYVTTQTLLPGHLAELSEEVGPDRSLLVLCGAFRANAGAFSNLTVRKIPNHFRNRCEWNRDDYSLNTASVLPDPGIAARL
jgi:adenine-specific DNA-methyltransferase